MDCVIPLGQIGFSRRRRARRPARARPSTTTGARLPLWTCRCHESLYSPSPLHHRTPRGCLCAGSVAVPAPGRRRDRIARSAPDAPDSHRGQFASINHVPDGLWIELEQLRHVVDRQELIWHGLSLIETVWLQASSGCRGVRCPELPATTVVGPARGADVCCPLERHTCIRADPPPHALGSCCGVDERDRRVCRG